MQLSHGNALSAVLCFFYGTEIIDVFTLCLLQQIEVILSRTSMSAENVNIVEKITFTGMRLLLSMQHCNWQILASADGAKGQQWSGNPPMSPKLRYLHKRLAASCWWCFPNCNALVFLMTMLGWAGRRSSLWSLMSSAGLRHTYWNVKGWQHHFPVSWETLPPLTPPRTTS